MSVSTTRLYASAIAIVSGGYAVASVTLSMLDEPMPLTMLPELGLEGWIMLVLGVVVLVHGLVLLTPAAHGLGRASGPLMVAWAAMMLLNQWLIGMAAETSMMATMETDPGMIAIATLMLISGAIMVARPMGDAMTS